MFALLIILCTAFGLADHTQAYVNIFSAMHRSGQLVQTWQEQAEEAWQDLQAVPSYFERHQRDRQFCEHGQYRSLCPACSPLA